MADVMHLVYQLSARNGIKNQFCKRNENVGRKWLKISYVVTQKFNLEPISRARGFTPESVVQFFLNLRTHSGHHST
jgi:hypothetical protein